MGFFSDLFARAGRLFGGGASTPETMDDATFEATLRQAVETMRGELNQVLKTSAKAISHYNRLEAEYRRHDRLAEDWQEKARSALKKGNEEFARKALGRKAESTDRMDALRPEVEEALQVSSSLKRQVDDLRRRIEETERNTGTLIARRNAARASKKVSRALAGLGEKNDAFSALETYEAAVAREEAVSRAYADLSVDPNEELARELGLTEASGVDAELARLRSELDDD